MGLTLNQAAKMSAIVAVILTGLGMGAAGFVYATDQARTQGKMEQTVEDHTKRLQRIESKIDALAVGVGNGPPQAIGFIPADRQSLVRSR